ncbi:MAG TPA: hypothetical protein VFE59_11710 [Trebonia sp.]|jgi:hypothetical protein|nr:hypothetical protein [Trebonia sp.]
MSHLPPASFPDPTQTIGTPMTIPHGTKPNPEYHDLLTLYAKVYAAEEELATALRPACRTAGADQAWIGETARKWVAELEGWSRRLNGAGERILAELEAQLRAMPPYVHHGRHLMRPGDSHP